MLKAAKLHLNKTFSLLDSRRDRVFFILFSGCFVMFFMQMFRPFNLSAGQFSYALVNRFPLAVFGILGMLILCLTQLGVREGLNWKNLNLGKYYALTLLEIFLLTLVIFALFRDIDRAWIPELLTVARQTFLVVILAYSFGLSVLYIWKTRSREAPAEGLSPLNQSSPVKPVHLKEENGKVMLSILPQLILLFKADANYVTVYYMQEESLQKLLLRNSLKKIEAECKHPRFLRVHRSYLVNLDHITRVNRSKRSYTVQVQGLADLDIPVAPRMKEEFAHLMEMA